MTEGRIKYRIVIHFLDGSQLESAYQSVQSQDELLKNAKQVGLMLGAHSPTPPSFSFQAPRGGLIAVNCFQVKYVEWELME